jgi:hypothetical protein
VTAADDAARLAIELELAADQAELELRRDTQRAAARNLAFQVARPDAATARRSWDHLTGVAAELAAIGDSECATVVGACARFLVAMQFSEYGSGRLRELGLGLGDA